MDKRLLYALLCVGCFFGAATLPGWAGKAMLLGMFVSGCLCMWHFLLAKQESMASSEPLLMPSLAEVQALKLAAEAKAVEAKLAAERAQAEQHAAGPEFTAPEATVPTAIEPAMVSPTPAPIIERPLTGRAVFDVGDAPSKKN
jgi:hypothetical protein